jgi:hypothetical protein
VIESHHPSCLRSQTPENEQALKSFQSSSEMRPEAWAWGEEFGLGGLEGLKLDVVVQNIL